MLQKFLIGAQFFFLPNTVNNTTKYKVFISSNPIITVPVGCYKFEGHITKPKLACLFYYSNNNDMDTDANNNKNI